VTLPLQAFVLLVSKCISAFLGWTVLRPAITLSWKKCMIGERKKRGVGRDRKLKAEGREGSCCFISPVSISMMLLWHNHLVQRLVLLRGS